MTTITLELPDELAAQVAALHGRLPDLLATALKSDRTGTTAPRRDRPNETESDGPLYREITDFLASDPLPEEITAFKVSPTAQARLEDLLERNREASRTADEAADIDAYLQARDLMILIKANARPAAT